MIIVRSPFRISFFGGSTDYKDFYQKHGSFIIGTTIDKYCYLSMRPRPKILSAENVIVYSKLQITKNIDDIQNPLIREILKYRNIDLPIELFTFSDVPSRTGLGGSSTFCVGLLYLINQLYKHTINKKELVQEAIKIEREILQEAGGIQDHIWPVYGGLNSIEINTNGIFSVKPLPVTEEFYKEIEKSVTLIYTNEQRMQEEIARSHEGKEKLRILDIAHQAYDFFLKEDIKSIGELLYESWKEKRGISQLISNSKIDQTIDAVMKHGAYGAKLLGTGGCGFVLAICNPKVKEILINTFKNDILPIQFESVGVAKIYS